MRLARTLAAAAAAVLLAACTSSGDPVAEPTELAIATLPPGDLRDLVLQPGDVQRDLVPLLAQTGPRDVRAIAAFSADPAAAEQSLRRHGFAGAYVVQYGDPESRAVVTNVVTRFATEAGATADLAADLAAAAGTGTEFDAPGLGEQAGGVRGPLDRGSGTGTLVTLRWRIDDTTWLLAVGAPAGVDEAGVRKLADLLVTRFRPVTGAPATPSPSP